MGTSKNERSPNVPPWRPALAVIGRTDVPTERQLVEIWRAAYGERGEKLIDDFSQPVLGEAYRLISERVPVHEALARFDEINQRENRAGLGIELGRRALARCAASGARSVDFVRELFAEATSYYASRDLPGFVAAQDRVGTNSEAIALKLALQNATRQTIETQGEPSPAGWAAHVERLIATLRGDQS